MIPLVTQPGETPCRNRQISHGDRMLTITTGNTRRMHARNVKQFTFPCFLVTIVILIALAAPAPAALIFQYETTLELDTGAVGVAHPIHVSCDPVSGEVCVTDVRQNTFHVANGRHVPLFRTGPFAGVTWPASGCLDRDGTILFTDTTDGRVRAIRKLDIFGEPAPFAPEIPVDGWNPRLLAVAADGDYLSLDTQHNLLARHAADTGALRWAVRVGDEGAANTQFGRPAEAPDGTIYVPGGDQRKIFTVSADGRPLGMFGRFGSGPGRVSLPVGVAFGPHGEILVLDRMRGKILVFDGEHAFQSEFGTIGSRAGQFYHPADIAAAPDGKVYVAQGFQGRVQVFRVFESSDPDAEKSARSPAAGVVDRFTLDGTAGSDRAATRPAGKGTAGTGSGPQVVAFARRIVH